MAKVSKAITKRNVSSELKQISIDDPQILQDLMNRLQQVRFPESSIEDLEELIAMPPEDRPPVLVMRTTNPNIPVNPIQSGELSFLAALCNVETSVMGLEVTFSSWNEFFSKKYEFIVMNGKSLNLNANEIIKLIRQMHLANLDLPTVVKILKIDAVTAGLIYTGISTGKKWLKSLMIRSFLAQFPN